MVVIAYGVQKDICANKTVKNPKSNPNATQVEVNNNVKLIPVIASGLTIEALVANITDDF